MQKQDIHYRQEQTIALALREEKKLKREAIYNQSNTKPDLQLAEIDHSLGMQGLKKISQQYFSVKNLDSRQENALKGSALDLLFDNDRFFYHQENKKLQDMIQSGQSPLSKSGSKTKIKSRQLSLTNLPKNNQYHSYQEPSSFTQNGQTHLWYPLERELIESVKKFSDNKQKMSFAQLGGFLNHINVLKHIKYDESSRLSNEQEIINSQQLNTSFSIEMYINNDIDLQINQLFILYIIGDYMKIFGNIDQTGQFANSELVLNITYFLLNKEQRDCSLLGLKDNILSILHNQSISQRNQVYFDEDAHKIIDDFIISWEQVVCPSKSEQIVRQLTSSKKGNKIKPSISKRENGSASKTPPINPTKSQNFNKNNIINSSGSKQNIINNNNTPQVYDISLSSSNEMNGYRQLVRSQSSSSSSQVGSNIQQTKKQQQNIQQDISNIVNQIKKYQDTFSAPQQDSNTDINQMPLGYYTTPQSQQVVHMIPQQKQGNNMTQQHQYDQIQIYNDTQSNNNQDYHDVYKQFGIQTASFQPTELNGQTANFQQENQQINQFNDKQIAQFLEMNKNIQNNLAELAQYQNYFDGNQTEQFKNINQKAQNNEDTDNQQVNNLLCSYQSAQFMQQNETMPIQDYYNPSINNQLNSVNGLLNNNKTNQNNKNTHVLANNGQINARQNRSQSGQYQFSNQNDQPEQIVQSWPQHLTKNILSSTSQQIQPFLSNEINSQNNQHNLHSSQVNDKQNEVYQSIKITEMSQNQYDQLQPNVEYQDNYKRITFSDQKQEFTIQSNQELKQESKYISPLQILQRQNLSNFDQEINNNHNIITPKKKSCMKKSNTQTDFFGRNISPNKSKEDQRLLNLINNHAGWKKDIIKNWIVDREDKEYEKQKDECTFQPNLGKSKIYIDKLSQNNNNVDVIQRLYDYSTPKKREMIQYQHLIEKECQELEKCTFKPNTNSNSKQYNHVSSRVGLSPISPNKKFAKYQSNNTQDTSGSLTNQPIKGFEQAVQRMKKGFEKTQDIKARKEKIRTGTMYETNKSKLFNPPSMLIRNSSSSSTQPFYFANVTLNNGKQGRVQLSEDDDPIEVALNFSKTFQLNKEMTENLKIVLIESYKQHIVQLLGEEN